MTEQFSIIHSHDGAGDDQMALLLLLTKYKLLATVLTPADSYLEPAKEMTQKLLTITNCEDIPFIVNDIDTPNTFPLQWRDESYSINNLIKIDKDYKHIKTFNLEKLVEIILASEKRIIFIETGPLTTLSQCLKLAPSIEHKISKVIWTGGSFGLNGFNPPDNCDGSQTYNSYCDPSSANDVWQTSIDIVLLTREVTEKAFLSKEFYENLPLSKYGSIFRDVYSFYVDQSYYRLWDVLTVSYIDIPNSFNHVKHRCKIIVEGESQGKTETCDDGKEVVAITNVDLNDFYSYVLKQLY